MSKLTEITEDLIIDSSGSNLSIDQALSEYTEYLNLEEHVRKISPRMPNSLFHAFIQSKALYRKNEQAQDEKVTLWLAQAEDAAKAFYLSHQAMPEFNGITREELTEIAHLSSEESIIIDLPEILAHKGIILIYLPAASGTKVDGATFLFANQIPVIAHSLRFPRMDNFWFTLMHELAHVSKHIDHLTNPIIDDLNTDEPQLEDIEIEANNLAKYSFIDRKTWRTATIKNTQSSEEIKQFAEHHNLHPAVVAGLVQHYQKRFDLFSDIIHHSNPREILNLHE